MTLPATDTVVLYPAGSTRNGAVVLHVEPVPDGRTAVLLDETACHPVDAGWPDQGTDRAVLLTSTGAEVAVTEAVVAATDGETLFIGADVPVRKGEEGWAFVVAHLVAPDAAIARATRSPSSSTRTTATRCRSVTPPVTSPPWP